MKNILIIGAGTSGTIMANQLFRKIDRTKWHITVIDKDIQHYYQPGFLFIPFQIYSEKDVVKDKRAFIPKGCSFILSEVDCIVPERNCVTLEDGRRIDYDVLIIATGTDIVPDEVQGLAGDRWRKDIFDFYTLEGAMALRERLNSFKNGKIVIHIAEFPIKCPVAPLEFVFMADWWFNKLGIRHDIELTYVTPLSGAFTKERSSTVLGHILEKKNIRLVTEFNVEKVNTQKRQLISFDEKSIDYDLLVAIPTNMGDQMIEKSGLGDELYFVPTKNTLQSKKHENIFVLGDSTDLPSSKAGSVAHFQSELLTKNIMQFIQNKPLKEEFDGHSNCFIESGYKKGILIDFNYTVDPVEGKFPFPILGPFPLLKESWLNHIGKLAFRWIYWNMLLKGIGIPGIPTKMSTKGKKVSLLGNRLQEV